MGIVLEDAVTEDRIHSESNEFLLSGLANDMRGTVDEPKKIIPFPQLPQGTEQLSLQYDQPRKYR